ncbi:MAG: AbrB/MazE/SpoVT family DNA-binding domain-containing protein [Thermoleophilaceae bacterium]
MRKRLRISKGGQVSVPAEVRKRWGTSTVIAEDEGERLVLRPAPDDPIDALMGIFAPEADAQREQGVTLEDIRAEDREIEAEAEYRRYGR